MNDAAAAAGATVLLFDDDIACRVEWRLLLERYGYRVVECATPEAVLEAVSVEPQAVILGDFEVAGFEDLLREARDGGRLRGLRIAVVCPDGVDDAPEGVSVLDRVDDLATLWPGADGLASEYPDRHLKRP